MKYVKIIATNYLSNLCEQFQNNSYHIIYEQSIVHLISLFMENEQFTMLNITIF